MLRSGVHSRSFQSLVAYTYCSFICTILFSKKYFKRNISSHKNSIVSLLYLCLEKPNLTEAARSQFTWHLYFVGIIIDIYVLSEAQLIYDDSIGTTQMSVLLVGSSENEY